MTEETQRDYQLDRAIKRRIVLKAAGASAALGIGTGTVGAQSGNGGRGNGGGPSTGDGSSNPNYIDPIFGKAVAEANPCAGNAENCFEEFRPPIRPDHEIEMRIDIEGLLFGLAEAGVLSPTQIKTLNGVVADGEITTSERENDLTFSVTLDGETVPADAIAGAMVNTLGFNYNPAGLHVEPGDIVLYSAESPDHLVAAYHEDHGRQNRVPDEVGPICSPMPPVGGYWLYQFEAEGVYDFYCSPHQTFGMVHRVVVHDGEGNIPTLDVEQTGRPPEDENAIAAILGGLDPNIPSSKEGLNSDALKPDNIVNNGPIPWKKVVTEHRTP